MNTWGLCFISCIIVPLLMVVVGIRFLKFQPKLKGVFGLRIDCAMTNEETWNFAHKYGGKLWIVLGIIMSVVIVLCMLIAININELIVGIIALIISMIELLVFIFSFSIIKKNIKKKFNI